MKKFNSISKEGAALCLLPLFFGILGAACTKRERNARTPEQEALYQKGRGVYQTSCVACHNPDAKKPGPLGPEIFGSSRELIEARVMRAEYPPGYQPKRTSKLMQPLPQFKADLDALWAYLNQ